MATHAPITGAPSRASTIRHPAALPPMPAVQRILLRYAHHDRETLEAFLSVAIDLLDLVDGDIDREATDLEDDFALSPIATDYAEHGPGCAISDQDAGAWIEWHTMRGSQKRGPNILVGQEDDEDDDPAGGDILDERHDAISWAEWHTLPGQQRKAGNYVGKMLDHVDRGNAREDDEDEDPAEEDDDSGQCDEDGINTAFGNGDFEAEGGAGCPISDPGGGNVTDEPHDEDDGM